MPQYEKFCPCCGEMLVVEVTPKPLRLLTTQKEELHVDLRPINGSEPKPTGKPPERHDGITL